MLRSLRVLRGLLLAALTVSICAFAPSAHAQSSAESLAVSSPAAAAALVAAPAPDRLAQAYASFTPENRAYARIRVALRLLGPWYGVLAGLFLLFSRLSARFRDVAYGLGKRLYVRVLVYFTLYTLAMFLLSLPLAWYEEYAVEHQFALSTQSWLGWLGDSLKGVVFSIVVLGVVPLLALAWSSIERQPRRWWLWLAAGTLPVALAAVLLQPLVFDPLFHRFTPLPDSPLRHQLLDLAARAGIPARHVYEIDMSTTTRKLNAYVNGFGASQRIVLWDTTLRAMKTDEILFVMGHEMGHYALGHIWKFVLFLGAGAYLVFFLVAQVHAWCVRRFGALWLVDGVADLAAMPMLAIAISLVMLAATPALNALTRATEHEADIFGLELTHDTDAAERAFLQLAEGNRSDPDPPRWIELLLYDHPPLAARIRFAHGYKPWESGQKPRFYPQAQAKGVSAPR